MKVYVCKPMYVWMDGWMHVRMLLGMYDDCIHVGL